MKNKTVFIVLLVIIVIGLTIFLINRKKEINNIPTPNPVTITEPTPTIIDNEVVTEVEPIMPTEPKIPSLPPAGYGPK